MLDWQLLPAQLSVAPLVVCDHPPLTHGKDYW
jgi:hypothetical protein